VGIAVCLQGFSTFNARPLLNVHDVFVKPEFRRNGVARKLFKRIEMKAHMLGCCKITLEVLEGNFGARRAYQQLGFGPYRINDQGGLAEFWQKYI
jgi:GNAT superfamily N-acetyltransferase